MSLSRNPVALFTRAFSVVCALSTFHSARASAQEGPPLASRSDSARLASIRHRNGRAARAARATRVDTPPKLDGRLDDAVWQSTPVERDFRRDVPSDGHAAAQGTEVRVVYDRDALYVGVRLFDDTPALVSRRLNRRDSFELFNDVFFVLIDSYHDHRSQFVFGVTPAGERRDAIGAGDGASLDPSWDPVWEAATHIDSVGWVAEMRIPFSQLRFPPDSQQLWGIQFRRDIVRAGEAVDWNWSPRTEPGSVSKYGHLVGLHDLPAPRRLELLPYASSQARLTQGADRRNPFDDGRVASAAGGLDLKYGLTSDLTLTATANPDFGQVEADPAVVNLTAFEVFFQERRPFFVEGASAFEFGNSLTDNRFFYSRRIGRAPSLSAAGTAAYVDAPIATSILGAAKLSGRTRSGWTIGLLEALTDREVAQRADASGAGIGDRVVEPMTNFTTARVRHEDVQGTRGFGAFASTVNRALGAETRDSLTSSALTGGVDFYRRFKGNAYQLTGWLGGSSVRGSPFAMTTLQRRPSRYFQRPDQDYLHLDSSRTSLGGIAGNARFQKSSGTNYYVVDGVFFTPGLELNDAGFQTQGDRIRMGGEVGHQWLTPGKYFRNALLATYGLQALNFGGNNVQRYAGVNASASTLGFTSLGANVRYYARSLDDRETRGGPLLQQPASLSVSGSIGSDGRKFVSGGGAIELQRDERGGTQVTLGPRLRLQPRSGWDAELSTMLQRTKSKAFYVTTVRDALATQTFGSRYVLAGLLRNTMSTSLRLNAYFTPNLTLQTYAQPLVATGNYRGFKEIVSGRDFRFNTYGGADAPISFDAPSNQYRVDPDGAGPASTFGFSNPDFHVVSLRSNVVLRWEYSPGSTIFLAWNNSGANVESDPRFRPLGDLGDVFRSDMRHVFLIKVNRYFSL